MTFRRPLILMSGGLDSTYLAYTLAKAGQSFDTLYVDGQQGVKKTAAEGEAQLLIRSYLKKQFGVSIRRVHSRSLVRYGDAPAAAFRQLMPWFVSAMEVVDPGRHSSVQMGYITGDQIVLHIPQIKAAWDLLYPVSKRGEFKVPLQFPLVEQFISKVGILHDLPEELYKLTWVCETPSYVWINDNGDTAYFPCGTCLACIGREVESHRRKLITGKETPLDNWMQAKVDYLAAHDNNPPKEAPLSILHGALIESND